MVYNIPFYFEYSVRNISTENNNCTADPLGTFQFFSNCLRNATVIIVCSTSDVRHVEELSPGTIVTKEENNKYG